MVFSSPIFLFVFLPLTVVFYYLTGKNYRNYVLLFASLVFYCWGEFKFLPLLLAVVLVNYVAALLLAHLDHQAALPDSKRQIRRKLVLAGCVTVNLLVLSFFKYANFLLENLNILRHGLGIAPLSFPQVTLPLGISFFTFHALSYTIDVYRRTSKPQTSFFSLALYIALFPQLIAGPIVRYHDVNQQLTKRKHSLTLFVSGIQRFIIGLAKKVLIANTMATVANRCFALSGEQVFPGLIWLGLISYTMQIYYDFSGYSDMAIGLAKMFGFRFWENFNYPYSSLSIQEFWRRWHISLSSWFRDYLYIPLGGNRGSELRTYFNLCLVFFLCGLWHGASWNFLLWGLYHGFFLVCERAFLGACLLRLPRLARNVYAMIVVVIGWLIFLSPDLAHIALYSKALLGLYRGQVEEITVPMLLSNEFLLMFCVGAVFSFPWLESWWKKQSSRYSLQAKFIMEWSMLFVVFVLALARLCASTYNPFIYFRF